MISLCPNSKSVTPVNRIILKNGIKYVLVQVQLLKGEARFKIYICLIINMEGHLA
jgi:hypothetical protein